MLRSFCLTYCSKATRNIPATLLQYYNTLAIFPALYIMSKYFYKYSYFFVDTTRVLCYIGCQQERTKNMIMIITVEIKTEYGQERIYPGCDEAKSFAKIAGTKTLTRETCKLIKQLGYTFDVYKRFNF